jgi:hypothetical protein
VIARWSPHGIDPRSRLYIVRPPMYTRRSLSQAWPILVSGASKCGRYHNERHEVPPFRIRCPWANVPIKASFCCASCEAVIFGVDDGSIKTAWAWAGGGSEVVWDSDVFKVGCFVREPSSFWPVSDVVNQPHACQDIQHVPQRDL